MKNELKKKNVISPAQVALFTGIAGLIANTMIEAIDHNQLVDQARNKTIDPNGTVVKNRKGLRSARAVDLNATAEKVVSENYPYIELVSNESSRYYLTQNVNLGRYPHNDIQVPDETASRVHCRIINKDGKYYLIDMEATTPARLNGTPVDNAKPTSINELYKFKLKDGDVITIGRTQYRFRECGKEKHTSPSFSTFGGTVVL